MYRIIVKPFFDRSIALLVFVLLLPLFLLVSMLLAFANSGNPFFVQQRPGKNARIFKIIKFKTMNDAKDTEGQLLPDAQRLTTLGAIIRKTSLDELPQLLNVIKGDMSFVGPRPLLPDYLPLYNNFQAQRHLVTPGITGWAQVNGRNAISWQQKFEYDVWYVQHGSFVLDVKILFLTIKKVIIKEGINQDGQSTMEVFRGN